MIDFLNILELILFSHSQITTHEKLNFVNTPFGCQKSLSSSAIMQFKNMQLNVKTMGKRAITGKTDSNSNRIEAEELLTTVWQRQCHQVKGCNFLHQAISLLSFQINIKALVMPFFALNQSALKNLPSFKYIHIELSAF